MLKNHAIAMKWNNPDKIVSEYQFNWIF